MLGDKGMCKSRDEEGKLKDVHFIFILLDKIIILEYHQIISMMIVPTIYFLLYMGIISFSCNLTNPFILPTTFNSAESSFPTFNTFFRSSNIVPFINSSFEYLSYIVYYSSGSNGTFLKVMLNILQTSSLLEGLNLLRSFINRLCSEYSF